jgi:hypothetical protein
MRRRSFLQTLAQGLISVSLAYKLGASMLEKEEIKEINPMWREASFDLTDYNSNRFVFEGGRYVRVNFPC